MSPQIAHHRLTDDGDRPSPQAAILIVESNAQIATELSEQLAADRYHVVVARTAQHARVLARDHSLHAVLLGAFDAPRGALDLLQEIRSSPQDPAEDQRWDKHLPAIVFGSGSRQIDLLRAFDAGADDFLARSTPYLELRARLRALLRRAEGPRRMRLLRVGQLVIDTHARTVCIADAHIDLSRMEYELLLHLARTPASVCSKQELLRVVWHHPTNACTRTVDSHASRLRRKLYNAGAHGFVVNVWGVGYRLT
jgi:DNA-binding response OmpR family regulator